MNIVHIITTMNKGGAEIRLAQGFRSIADALSEQ
jgi:hypothetical protein